MGNTYQQVTEARNNKYSYEWIITWYTKSRQVVSQEMVTVQQNVDQQMLKGEDIAAKIVDMTTEIQYLIWNFILQVERRDIKVLMSKFKILAKFQVYLVKHPLKSVLGWKMITSMPDLLKEWHHIDNNAYFLLYLVQRFRIGCQMALNNDKYNPAQDSMHIRNMVTIF